MCINKIIIKIFMTDSSKKKLYNKHDVRWFMCMYAVWRIINIHPHNHQRWYIVCIICDDIRERDDKIHVYVWWYMCVYGDIYAYKMYDDVCMSDTIY